MAFDVGGLSPNFNNLQYISQHVLMDCSVCVVHVGFLLGTTGACKLASQWMVDGYIHVKLITCRALAPVWRRCEQNHSVVCHRKVVWLLWLVIASA